MSYNDYTLNSKSLIKRYTHRTRYGVGLHLCLHNSPKTILDYGTGSAHILYELNKSDANLEIYGYEPIPEMYLEACNDAKDFPNIHLVQNVNEIPIHYFDKVTCFEVFEHLDEHDTIYSLENFKTFLKPQGEIIVSIPIETGFASLCKNIVRYIIGAPQDKNWKNILDAFQNKNIQRDYSDQYFASHVGFNHKNLEQYFMKCGLKIISRYYSPISKFKLVVNSQIFYRLKVL